MCQGLGAREVYVSSGHNFSLSREQFFVLGDVWVAAMEGEPLSVRSYQHIAFSVTDAELPDYQEKLEAIGVEIRAPRERVDGEGQSLFLRLRQSFVRAAHWHPSAKALALFGSSR